MASEELVTRVREAARQCERAVSGQRPGSPADAFATLARSCEELGIDAWDTYGDGGAVRRRQPRQRANHMHFVEVRPGLACTVQMHWCPPEMHGLQLQARFYLPPCISSAELQQTLSLWIWHSTAKLR